MGSSGREAAKGLIQISVLVLSLLSICKVTCGASSVQTVAKAAPGSSSTLSLAFPANTASGEIILVAFDFDTNSTPSSVADSQGNIFTEVGVSTNFSRWRSQSRLLRQEHQGRCGYDYSQSVLELRLDRTVHFRVLRHRHDNPSMLRRVLRAVPVGVSSGLVSTTLR